MATLPPKARAALERARKAGANMDNAGVREAPSKPLKARAGWNSSHDSILKEGKRRAGPSAPSRPTKTDLKATAEAARATAANIRRKSEAPKTAVPSRPVRVRRGMSTPAAENTLAKTGEKKTAAGNYPVYKKVSAPAQSFRSAFAAARKAGKSVFTWQGRKYSTKTK